jgi:hypothetical protein
MNDPVAETTSVEKFASEPPEGLRVALWRCDTDHHVRQPNISITHQPAQVSFVEM